MFPYTQCRVGFGPGAGEDNCMLHPEHRDAKRPVACDGCAGERFYDISLDKKLAEYFETINKKLQDYLEKSYRIELLLQELGDTTHQPQWLMDAQFITDGAIREQGRLAHSCGVMVATLKRREFEIHRERGEQAVEPDPRCACALCTQPHKPEHEGGDESGDEKR